jgi:hypothetical protein
MNRIVEAFKSIGLMIYKKIIALFFRHVLVFCAVLDIQNLKLCRPHTLIYEQYTSELSL